MAGKSRAPYDPKKQAAGATSPAPAAVPMTVPAFNRRILPKEVLKAIKEAGIGDAEIPLFWAAYERGRQDEREGIIAQLSIHTEALARHKTPMMGWTEPQKFSAIESTEHGMDHYKNGNSHRPDDDALPSRPDLDAMERAKAQGAPGGGDLREVRRIQTGQSAAGAELPVGRYGSEVVTKYVQDIREFVTDFEQARLIIREYLTECEPRCANPPSSSGRVIIGRLKKAKIFRGSDTENMGRAEDIDEGEASQAAETFGLAE